MTNHNRALPPPFAPSIFNKNIDVPAEVIDLVATGLTSSTAKELAPASSISENLTPRLILLHQPNAHHYRKPKIKSNVKEIALHKNWHTMWNTATKLWRHN